MANKEFRTAASRGRRRRHVRAGTHQPQDHLRDGQLLPEHLHGGDAPSTRTTWPRPRWRRLFRSGGPGVGRGGHGPGRAGGRGADHPGRSRRTRRAVRGREPIVRPRAAEAARRCQRVNEAPSLYSQAHDRACAPAAEATRARPLTRLRARAAAGGRGALALARAQRGFARPAGAGPATTAWKSTPASPCGTNFILFEEQLSVGLPRSFRTTIGPCRSPCGAEPERALARVLPPRSRRRRRRVPLDRDARSCAPPRRRRRRVGRPSAPRGASRPPRRRRRRPAGREGRGRRRRRAAAVPPNAAGGAAGAPPKPPKPPKAAGAGAAGAGVDAAGAPPKPPKPPTQRARAPAAGADARRSRQCSARQARAGCGRGCGRRDEPSKAANGFVGAAGSGAWARRARGGRGRRDETGKAREGFAPGRRRPAACAVRARAAPLAPSPPRTTSRSAYATYSHASVQRAFGASRSCRCSQRRNGGSGAAPSRRWCRRGRPAGRGRRHGAGAGMGAGLGAAAGPRPRPPSRDGAMRRPRSFSSEARWNDPASTGSSSSPSASKSSLRCCEFSDPRFDMATRFCVAAARAV